MHPASCYIPPRAIFVTTSGNSLFIAIGNVAINVEFLSPGARDTCTAVVRAQRVLVGAIRSAALIFEAAEAEDAGDEWPEIWDVGDEYRSRCFACVPVREDQGAVGSSAIGDSIEDGAKDLL